MGHDEKLLAVNAIVLRDQAGKAFSADDIGMIILSGPKAYINTGVAWMAMNS